MAYLFEIDTTTEKGGLIECLKKASVHEKVIEWVVGDGEKELYCESLIDFVHTFSTNNYEDKIKDKLVHAKLPSLEASRDLGKQVARLRHAWKCGHHSLEKGAAMAAMPQTDAEWEAPLPKGDQEDLSTAWHKTYGVVVQGRLMGGDALVNRTFREWRATPPVPTIPEATKIRSQVAAVQPRREERTHLGGSKYLSEVVEPEITIRTAIDYYWSLRTLANTWGYVGNYKRPFGGKDVIVMPLDQAVNYADDTLLWTMESGVPGHTKLEWCRSRDVATRTKMMELMRQPPHPPASVALREALDFLRNDWKPQRVTLRGRDEGRSDRGRPHRSRSPRRDQPRSRPTVASTAKGGFMLCPDYNRGSCKDERRCPRRQNHLCNFRKEDGTACALRHTRIHNHKDE